MQKIYFRELIFLMIVITLFVLSGSYFISQVLIQHEDSEPGEIIFEEAAQIAALTDLTINDAPRHPDFNYQTNRDLNHSDHKNNIDQDLSIHEQLMQWTKIEYGNELPDNLGAFINNLYLEFLDSVDNDPEEIAITLMKNEIRDYIQNIPLDNLGYNDSISMDKYNFDTIK